MPVLIMIQPADQLSPLYFLVARFTILVGLPNATNSCPVDQGSHSWGYHKPWLPFYKKKMSGCSLLHWWPHKNVAAVEMLLHQFSRGTLKY